MSKLVNISELSIMLNLIDPETKKPLNHILRYWEKNLEIKPKMINEYYSPKQVEIIKMIKFLLKNKGMTIDGAKNTLNSKRNKLDGDDVHSLKNDNLKNYFKFKSKSILKKIVDLKNYGKKISS